MIDKAKGTIGGLTDLGLALLALAIVLTLLVGAGNMAFFGYSKDRYLVPRAITICFKAYE